MRRFRYFGWWIQGWFEYVLFRLHLRNNYVRMGFANIWRIR
jgi:hypothetical protein